MKNLIYIKLESLMFLSFKGAKSSDNVSHVINVTRDVGNKGRTLAEK